MYKYIGLGLFGIFFMMLIPSSIVGQIDDPRLGMYGHATLVQHDAEGNEVFTQTVHNRLADTGEIFMLQSSFSEGTSTGIDSNAIGAICITNAGAVSVSESATAQGFADDNNISGAGINSCITDNAVDITTVTSQATIGPLTFQSGTHIKVGDTVKGIGICQSASDDSKFRSCTKTGILFAVLTTSDVTLTGTESVQITYNFDLRSPST